MISREDVEHVAKLSRLRLGDAELDRMAGELSSILDHIDLISELDLEGVEPTTHVAPVTGALRDDEPRPSLEREVALSSAPSHDDAGFLVPSPQAGDDA